MVLAALAQELEQSTELMCVQLSEESTADSHYKKDSLPPQHTLK